jgi:hypothetical protein
MAVISGTPADCKPLGRRAVLRHFLSESIIAAVAATLFLIPSASWAQCPTQVYNVATRVFDVIQPHPGTTRTLINPLTADAPPAVLTIVALGDSVVWGNGLKTPDKFIELAGHQTADKTQRNVQIVSFAHSGAKLSLHPDPDAAPSPKTGYVPIRESDNGIPPGDLNSSYPTTSEQADCAAAAYPNAEIVVLDGCINEVNAMDIALPPIVNHTSKQQIAERVYQFCSTQMKETLIKVKTAFPKAVIILINYYQIVSYDSSIWRVASTTAPPADIPRDGSSEKDLERLAKERLRIEKMKGNQPTSQEIDKSAIQSWPENATTFLTTSEACFRWAIAAAPTDVPANAGTDAGPACSPPRNPLPTPSPDAVSRGSRVYLATLLNRPAYAYGGKMKHLWSLPIQILFWTIHADDMYRVRKGLCKSHYRGHDEAGAQEECRINPIAHPNEDGAKAYSCSIVLDPALKCDPNQPGILDQAWART